METDYENEWKKRWCANGVLSLFTGDWRIINMVEI